MPYRYVHVLCDAKFGIDLSTEHQMSLMYHLLTVLCRIACCAVQQTSTCSVCMMADGVLC